MNRPSRFSRRWFLKACTLISVLLPSANTLAGPLTQKRILRSIAALPAWLDTLIPEDDSPAATTLGVDTAIIASVRGNKSHQKLLLAGCAWLDQQAMLKASLDFASADSKTREAIVSQAEMADHDTLENVFFQFTRNAAFKFYYAEPATWPSLSYNGPPQPLGFSDYQKKPS